jgi:hypothetical protein
MYLQFKTPVRHLNFSIFFTVIAFCSLSSLPLHATDYYVNDNSLIGDSLTTAVGNDSNTGGTGDPFATIQYAIDVASNGDVILIDAGTYFENVEVNKEVILCGVGQALTIVRPANSNPTGGSLASAIFYVQASNVLIHDLTADGKNDFITGVGDIDASTGIITDWTFGTGDWDNLEVYNVTVKDVYYRGLQATFNSTPNLFFDFYDNIIDGVQGDPQSIGILNWGDAGIIENNIVTNCTNGIVTNESFGTDIFDNNVTGIAGGTCIESDNNGEAGGASLPDYITGNTVTGGANGIVVYQPYLITDVNENTVSAATSNGISVIGGPGSVSIYQNAATITGASIGVDIDGGTAALIENDINTNGTGVRVKGGGILIIAFENFIKSNTGDGLLIESDGTVSTGIFDNDLSDNDGYAINNQSANTIYASCNWYGTKDPEDIAAEINGDVEYVNWLTSGIDDLSAFPGFQPELDACNGNVITNTRNSETFSLIADAMNDADFLEGDELTIPECVYPGCFTIGLDVMITPLGSVYFDCIDMDGIDKNLILGGNLNIFDLTLSNGKIHTNGFNLSCGTINGGGPTNYIVTD